MTHRLIVTALTALVLASCATPTAEKKARAIFNDANYYFAKGKFEHSQKRYQTILDEFPDTPFRVNALLGSADAYYMLGEYFLSAPLYEQYQDLYPLHENIVHARLYEAMSYYRDVMKMERDQTNTTKALEAFSYFVIKYPDHPAAPFAKDQIVALDDKLAQKQIQALEFYYRIDSFVSCIARADLFVEMYPETKYVPHAIMLKGKSYREEEAFKKAEKAFREVVEIFPDTPEAAEAKTELKKLKPFTG
jgi:outer membrane protein assembly factor BamD